MVALPLRIRAIFQDGKFVPQEPCALPDAAEVQWTVERANIIPPKITDPVERQRILDEVVLTSGLIHHWTFDENQRRHRRPHRRGG